MSKQPEALRLADWLEKWAQDYAGTQLEDMALTDAAAELRRLVAENEALKSTLKGWLDANGPNGWIEDLRKQRDELLEVLKKLEYSSDGYIKRYPEEAEVNAAIARAEGAKK